MRLYINFACQTYNYFVIIDMDIHETAITKSKWNHAS